MMKKKEIMPLIFCILVATIGRIVPHPANVTPLMSLVILSGLSFNRERQLTITITSLVFSDLLLSTIYDYSFFGSWTLFTYTGLAGIAFISQKFLSTKSKLFEIGIVTGVSSILYWLWTNFGTWLLSGMYPHSLQGIIYCYVAGIPFLRSSLMGDLVWVCVLRLLIHHTSHINDHLKTMKSVWLPQKFHEKAE